MQAMCKLEIKGIKKTIFSEIDRLGCHLDDFNAFPSQKRYYKRLDVCPWCFVRLLID